LSKEYGRWDFPQGEVPNIRPGFGRGAGPALPPRGPPFGVSSGAHIAVTRAGGRGSSWVLCTLSPRRRRLGARVSSRPVRALHPIGANPNDTKFLQNPSGVRFLKKKLLKTFNKMHKFRHKNGKNFCRVPHRRELRNITVGATVNQVGNVHQ